MAAQAGLTLSMFSMAWVLNPAENIWTLIVLGTIITTFAGTPRTCAQ